MSVEAFLPDGPNDNNEELLGGVDALFAFGNEADERLATAEEMACMKLVTETRIRVSDSGVSSVAGFRLSA